MDTRMTGWDRSNHGLEYAVTTDGQRFLVNTASDTTPLITLIRNRTAVLHQQTQ
jgi:hypothetical protein